MSTKRGTRSRWVIGIGLIAIGAAGCADSTGPEDSLTPEAAEAIALFMVDVDATAGWSTEALVEQRRGPRDFNRSAPCPAGGTRSFSGNGDSSLDEATRILSTSWTTVLAHDDCAFTHRRRDQPVTTVIKGRVTGNGSATYQLPEDRSERRDLLTYSATRVGSTTTTVGDRSRTCEIDVTETYDPATGSFHVTGIVCGRRVDITRTPGGRRDG